MTTNHEITPDELEAACDAINNLLESDGTPKDITSGEIAKAAITAFLECRNKKGQGDDIR